MRLLRCIRLETTRYIVVVIPKLKNLLERAEAWSETNQEQLAEHAEKIRSHRTGIYVITGYKGTIYPARIVRPRQNV
jgi:hypothetical protein